MSLAASIVRDVDAADDQRVAGLQPVQVEPVPDPERKGLGGCGGGRSLVDIDCGGGGAE